MHSNTCPACGGQDFAYSEVLWPELVRAWQLTPLEKDYINRQQGLHCTNCKNNLRAMALADAILRSFHFGGTLLQFVQTEEAQNLKILEINEAGELTPILKMVPNHQIARYPEYDMTHLPFDSESFDLVTHSDTLEHVPNAIVGLSECHRLLKNSGRCIFTVPIVVDRMTRSRAGLIPSFHGNPDDLANDYIVHSEFGADVWKYAIEAGFNCIKIHSFEYPAALVLEASKSER